MVRYQRNEPLLFVYKTDKYIIKTNFLKNMEIKIKDKTVKLRYTFMSDMIYENIQQKTFTGQLQSEWIWYFYSTFLALSDEMTTTMDEFIEELDKQPKLLTTFIKWYVEEQKVIERLSGLDEDKEKTKKKQVKKSKN